MDIVFDLMDQVVAYCYLVIDFLSPYSVEIIIGLIMVTFFFGLIYSHK